jgi:fructose-1,6-bisphosphatase/inositol monophosphatase family enzyme
VSGLPASWLAAAGVIVVAVAGREWTCALGDSPVDDLRAHVAAGTKRIENWLLVSSKLHLD